MAIFVIVLIDDKTSWTKPVRAALFSAASPFYKLSNTPNELEAWGEERLLSRADLIEQNRALKTESLILQRKLQRMAALTAENGRLRALLNSAKQVEQRVTISELIGVEPDPRSHIVIVNRGESDQVHEGQSVIDASGMMGQVVAVGYNTAKVMLITDQRHAIPVLINRTGERAIAEGTGDINRLRVRHLSPTTDIRVGDLLVSSGLGGRFPVGYPVAEVVQVDGGPGKTFLEVQAKPLARLSQSRYMLLLRDADEL